MSSLIIGEAQETTYKNEVVTTSLTPKYFLVCESCFWCASYCDSIIWCDSIIMTMEK